VVQVAPEEEPNRVNPLSVFGVIWSELSGGIGPWGTFRPLVALALSLIPFLFLGQHFNRQHSKAARSIGDAWWVSSRIVASAQNE
jgi:hypothetical protein